jgi:hypothetical protein
LLHQYRNDILTGLAVPSTNDEAEQQHIPRPPNQHVSFMSRRQRRNKIGTPDRGNISVIFHHNFLLQLLGRLGSPILLTPQHGIAPANNNRNSSGVILIIIATTLIQVEQTSVGGTDAIFVYDECAVLIGVHGAGLTNALGLRPGTAVIELMSRRRKADYQYFANVVALADGDGPDHEENLHAMGGDDQDRELLGIASTISCSKNYKKASNDSSNSNSNNNNNINNNSRCQQPQAEQLRHA